MTPNMLPRDSNRQLAVFIGGDTDVLSLVEPVLDGQAYDVEFVAHDDQPYATVLALKPDLVIVGLDLDEPSGFQLLSMLRLDKRTALIPVLSFMKDASVASPTDRRFDPNPSRLADVHAPRAQRH